ncbi:S9 family peptidase [Bythopirellula goksoeyrii]|nr:S9 family peptidase [Bythopirellula goksoeyrii]
MSFRSMLLVIVAGLAMPHFLSSAEGQTSTAEQPTSNSTEEPTLIPRSILFGNPQRANARVSPNGKWLSFLAPVDGILNVWVAPIDDLEKAKPVTKDKVRDIRGHYWAYTGDHIIYTQDKAGDENWHIYVTDVATGETKDLTPLDNIHAQVQDVSQKFPNEILVGLNDRIPQLHDIYRVDILTGDRELIQQNEGMAAYVTDDDFDVRFAFNYTPEGGTVLMKPKQAGETGEGAEWENFIETGPEDAMNTGPAGFDKSGNVLYLQDSRKRDTGALFAINLETGDKKLVAEDPRADVGSMIVHPTEKTIQAVSFNYTRDEWKILDESIRADLEYLESVEDGEVLITSRTLDDKLWTVAFLLDDGPIKFYLYDRPNKKASFLFSSRDDLDQYKLAKMHTPVIKSRDGLNLVSYLTLPVGSDPDGDGVPDKPLPLVLDVHGGPWARDEWGFNSTHQWLADRGYAVLSVNYRGSTGFGKNFTNAANGEWSRKMHDDLIDSVNWAVDEGIAQRDKIAIMGGSYGGYATLVGLTYTPDVFACGVDIVGPSSLVTLLQNIPPYWVPFMPVMKVRVGDVETEEGQAELLERSPLTRVDKIARPLLIGQGANDPRVTQLEADQIVGAMKIKHIPVTYVLYPDEGHGFAGEQNRMSFNAVTEAFLAEHLGGEVEPVGDDFEGSSIHVPVGADEVTGVAEALSKDRLEMPPKEEKAAE